MPYERGDENSYEKVVRFVGKRAVSSVPPNTKSASETIRDHQLGREPLVCANIGRECVKVQLRLTKWTIKTLSLNRVESSRTSQRHLVTFWKKSRPLRKIRGISRVLPKKRQRKGHLPLLEPLDSPQSLRFPQVGEPTRISFPSGPQGTRVNYEPQRGRAYRPEPYEPKNFENRRCNIDARRT